MITYPITIPSSPGVRNISWHQRSIVAVGASPFTGEQQIYRHQGQWWEVEINYPAVRDRAIAEAMVAALVSLNGPEGTFWLGDSVGKLPRGSISGSVQVGTGASKFSTTLPLQGGTGTFALGDWLQIGGALYKVIKVGSGEVDVWPRLRSAYAAGTAITYNNAKGIFRLSGQYQWSVDEVRIYGLSFTAREAI